MKLSSAQIEQTLHQLNAKIIPAEHPMMAQLERIFGEHTYFLDGNGLNIVEPVETEKKSAARGVVVNVASWADARADALQPHDPEPTDLLVDLETDRRH